ncbi:AraC family transcriptional regulator [Hahella aquimaris]|uniref:AraC family transcriptional regulator n=1 Tax=Hahella sp. HNIBRBA332 TaxID=3015983 RepID=UPI00273B3BCC|nr:AraC family transcriptional regulator [Hahella sp. HNIBRBA332]WLQ16962.1 AraC family transcriptional regulator [Hahella sp. HNIBRBA332]
MNYKNSLAHALFLIVLLLSAMARAEEDAEDAASADVMQLADDEEMASVDPDTPIVDQVQSLKQKAIELNRDLFILEEDLLFPASTQFVVFLSVDVGEFFQLDAVEVKIDGETVASHLYTQRQAKALYKGGMQRLHIGNLKTGEHEITAFFTGVGPNGRDYKRGATQKFEKGSDIKTLELRITDSTKKYQPEFTVVEWE